LPPAPLKMASPPNLASGKLAFFYVLKNSWLDCRPYVRLSSDDGGTWSEPTLVVAHGGAMRAALALLCGFTQSQLWAFDLPYGALLSLRAWPGPPRSAQIMGLWP